MSSAGALALAIGFALFGGETVRRTARRQIVMSSLLVALFVFCLVTLPVFSGSAAAQGGNAQAGKTLWDGPATQCKNCHGGKGEGAFGPDLAGRKLTVAQFRQAFASRGASCPPSSNRRSAIARSPISSPTSIRCPPSTQPGPWRFEVPANAPRGQQLALAGFGCVQCHGPTLNGPRQDAGMVRRRLRVVQG